MNYTKYIILFVLALSIISCEQDDRDPDFDTAAPANINATFKISQDNTGIVSITPEAENATTFQVFLGDTPDNSQILGVGESVMNTYAEGIYDIRIIASGITGLKTETIVPLTVSFQAPQNLMLNITPVAGSNFDVNVSATADLETSFEFYPGEFEDEAPISFNEGDVATYIYSSVGAYTARVVALSGGAETTEVTQEIVIVNPLLLPVTFEDVTLNYNFGDFGGAATSIQPNPDTSGENTSATVARSIKNNGAEVFAGTVITLDAPIDFSSLNNIRIRTYSPKSGITVKMKLENAADGNISTEVDVVNTVADAWETLTFDFSNSDLDQEYSKIIVFFDFGNTGDGSTYYFDDIARTTAVASGFDLFQDFEGTPPTFTQFGEMAPPRLIANQNPSGENTTATVAEYVKSNGAADFAGAFFELENSAIDFNGINQLRLKSYSPTVGSIIKVKLENADASITTEVDVSTTVANQWETLTYNFAEAPDAKYSRVVVFYDFGNAGNGNTYYFDEMEVGSGELVSTVPPFNLQDFEGTAPTFTSFGGNSDVQIMANPNSSDVNNSAMTAQITKGDGAEVFAGSFFEVSTPLDFDTYSNVRVRTISPATGLVVKLRLENADNSIGAEVDITNSVANEWEILEFDFSDAPAADYVRVVIFFDFGNGGAGTTHSFDEFELTN